MNGMHIGIIALVALGLIGFGVTRSDMFQDVTGGQDNVALVNTHWKLTELNGDDFSMPEGMKREPNFILEVDNNRMSGFAGCNKMSGTYVLVGKKLNFPDGIVMTRMACASGMDVEQSFTQALQATTGWHIKGSKLELRDKNGDEVAAFEQVLME